MAVQDTSTPGLLEVHATAKGKGGMLADALLRGRRDPGGDRLAQSYQALITNDGRDDQWHAPELAFVHDLLAAPDSLSMVVRRGRDWVGGHKPSTLWKG